MAGEAGFATRYAFGVGSVATGSGGGAMADIENSGCLILWGYNPSYTRLTHATATVAALKRGMKLIVIDCAMSGLRARRTSGCAFVPAPTGRSRSASRMS